MFKSTQSHSSKDLSAGKSINTLQHPGVIRHLNSSLVFFHTLY